MDPSRILFRIRLALGIFIIGLVVSGVTAFPLQSELEIAAVLTGADEIANPAKQPGFLPWIAHVRDGLRVTYDAYPFIAYGTDWLAFGHLVIALFFLGPLVDPVRNIFVIYAGLWACVLVIPLAMICGPLREIPIYWRLVDCAFGVGGFLPLWYALRQTKRLENVPWRRFTIPSDGR
jgi:hypothetical protein